MMKYYLWLCQKIRNLSQSVTDCRLAKKLQGRLWPAALCSVKSNFPNIHAPSIYYKGCTVTEAEQ